MVSQLNKSYFMSYDDKQGWNWTSYFSLWNDLFREDQQLKYAEIFFICLLVFCCFVENTFFIIFYASRKKLWTTSNLIILNMSVASLGLLPFTLIVGITRLQPYWMFGDAACKLTCYFIPLTAFTKIWMMTIMSIDRYRRIVHADKKQLRPWQLKLMLIAAWVIPGTTLAGILMPNTYTKDVEADGVSLTICTLMFHYHPKVRIILVSLSTTFLLEFIVPLSIMVFCYSNILLKLRSAQRALDIHNKIHRVNFAGTLKSRQGTIDNLLRRSQQQELTAVDPQTESDQTVGANGGRKPQSSTDRNTAGHRVAKHGPNRKTRSTIMLIAILILFLVMWLPLFLVLSLVAIDTVYETYRFRSQYYVIVICSLLLNTCINPILYAFATQTFRSELRRTCFGPRIAPLIGNTSVVETDS